jgi:hypothetical protein
MSAGANNAIRLLPFPPLLWYDSLVGTFVHIQLRKGYGFRRQAAALGLQPKLPGVPAEQQSKYCSAD